MSIEAFRAVRDVILLEDMQNLKSILTSASKELTEREAIALSYLKWKHNRAIAVGIQNDYCAWSLGYTGDTCALCYLYGRKCSRCPLYKVNALCDDEDSPWSMVFDGDKRELLAALRRAARNARVEGAH